MSNEAYLVLSYWTVAGLCLAAGSVVYLSLRRSFLGLISFLPTRALATVLKRVFFLGVALPALLGFCSVSYKGCAVKTYDQVVENRSYIVEKNQEQLAVALTRITYALFGWSLVVLGVLLIIRKGSTPDKAPEERTIKESAT